MALTLTLERPPVTTEPEAKGDCTHPSLHVMYPGNGKKYMVCTQCGAQWEV